MSRVDQLKLPRKEEGRPPDLSPDEWRALSREEIVLRYSPMVKFVVGRIALRLPSSVELDDLFQAGILGLIDAVSRFDPERGFKFQTYAEFRVRGAILDELRAMDWAPRAVRHASDQIEEAYHTLENQLGRPADDDEVARHLGLSLDDFYAQLDASRGVSIVSFEDLQPSDDGEGRDILEVLADPNVVDPVETMGLRELRRALAQAVSSLPEKERLVVTLYYYEELTMSEIGAVMKLTESRISQLHSKAALRMRARIKRFLSTGR
ncbi:MAG: FliA/WhiG family RNA polymerase sigma factor [Magnetococcales bacterium]|nr:FliA/WhiG family RNA polymerase sigma factor [Magnetococcales bacterium]